MNNNNKTVSVFVGNIAYQTTEEQLIEILSEVGPIVSFRMAPNKETGMHRGYGFCVYPDMEIAQSAVRNLDGREIWGRKITVNFSKQESSGGGSSNTHNQQTEESIPLNPNTPSYNPPSIENAMEPLEQVSHQLNSMSEIQLRDILADMKGIIETNPEDAKQILINNPQLAVSLFNAQIVLGMVTTLPQSFNEHVNKKGEQSSSSSSSSSSTNSMEVESTTTKTSSSSSSSSSSSGNTLSGGQATDTMVTESSGGNVDHQNALNAVMSLTPEQINALDPQSREQVLALRQQMGMQF